MPEIERPVQAKGMVHYLIANAAKGIAEAFHEEACGANARFYKTFPSARGFSKKHWEAFIPMARDALTSMLERPDIHASQKEAIYGALLLDASINLTPSAEAAPMVAPDQFMPSKEVH